MLPRFRATLFGREYGDADRERFEADAVALFPEYRKERTRPKLPGRSFMPVVRRSPEEKRWVGQCVRYGGRRFEVVSLASRGWLWCWCPDEPGWHEVPASEASLIETPLPGQDPLP